MSAQRLRVGTRGSALALAQARQVIAALRALDPTLRAEEVIVQTSGDRSSASLRDIGGQGAFTRELEVALLDGRVDVAVHSLKDLPSSLPEGLVVAATPPREDPRDVLVPRTAADVTTLPPGARVGTGSLRRRAQLLALRPDLRVADIRGNVDTRLRKLEAGTYDALVLAAAGLRRLGRTDLVERYALPLELMVPAPAQGILGLECRADDLDTVALLRRLNHAPTFAAAAAERALLRRLGAGCRLPRGRPRHRGRGGAHPARPRAGCQWLPNR
ncbi:MAG: hydroxymethylbilane synthase [Ardenticatenia bacterium]|nr:hydroxymethylbilane synthase [Ardenticatenia bacterium]